MKLKYDKRRLIIRPPMGVAQRRPGGLFHVMRRIKKARFPIPSDYQEVWTTKD